MAGITFTVELDDAALRARLADLLDRMERPLGFYERVGEYLASEAVQRNFQTETAPDGTPWASLSAVRMRQREKAGTVPVTILRDTKHLFANIVSQPREDGVEVGSAVPYAAVMQFGARQGAFGRTSRNGPIPWGDIPARPYLGLSNEDEAEIIRIADAWLEDGTASA